MSRARAAIRAALLKPNKGMNKGKKMENIKNIWNKFYKNYLSTTAQVKRITILTGIALILAVVSFGSYYYYDRYYTAQPKTADAMISEAEKAVRDDPQNPDKRLNLAETYMLNRRFDDALATANEVMAAYPDNQRAWLVVGLANALNGKPAGAVGPLQKYLDANKDAEMPGLNKPLQSAAYYLGDSYLQLGQPDKAVPPLEKAVEWSQTDADAMYKLGMAYMGVKEYDKAVAMFHDATTFVPNFTEAYAAMTGAYEALKEPDLANYARGMESCSKKDYPTARDLLLKAAKAKPDSAFVFSGLGLTYEGLNDLKNAKTSYETALKLDPNDFSASSGLQRVNALLLKQQN
jgi:tetratricopeptide (TPR) repeat protein